MFDFSGSSSQYLSWPVTSTLENSVLSFGGVDRSFLIAMWVYPTTLTAGRTLWSGGTTGVGPRVEIDTVTDEFRLWLDGVTVDGQFTTAGVDLAVNTPTFVAFFVTVFDTTTYAVRVWRGSIDGGVVECTVTEAVTPTGGFNAVSIFCLGNNGAGSVAWQGYIGSTWVIKAAAFTNDGRLTFPIAANGVCTDYEADAIKREFVEPIFAGRDISNRLWCGPGMSGVLRLDAQLFYASRSFQVVRFAQPVVGPQYTAPWMPVANNSGGLVETHAPTRFAPYLPNRRALPAGGMRRGR